MNVELKDMNCILAVSEERSFSRAAEKCFLTQPAVSRIVRRVEDAVGTPIFDRSTSPLTLTPDGEVLVGYFKKISEICGEMAEYTETIRRKKTGGLTIGAPSFFCTYLLPRLIAEYRLKNPELPIRLIETNDDDLRRFLSSGIVDFGFSVETGMPPQCGGIPVMREHLLLAVPKDLSVNEALAGCALSWDDVALGRYLSGNCPAADMAAFSGEKFLMLKRGNDTSRRVMKLCRDAGFDPVIVMELDQMLSSYYLAETGAGIALVRAAIPQAAGRTGRLVFYRINHPDTERDVYLYHKKGGLNQIQRSFFEYLRESGVKRDVLRT